jgi:hypothetical protein
MLMPSQENDGTVCCNYLLLPVIFGEMEFGSSGGAQDWKMFPNRVSSVSVTCVACKVYSTQHPHTFEDLQTYYASLNSEVSLHPPRGSPT